MECGCVIDCIVTASEGVPYYRRELDDIRSDESSNQPKLPMPRNALYAIIKHELNVVSAAEAEAEVSEAEALNRAASIGKGMASSNATDRNDSCPGHCAWKQMSVHEVHMPE